MVGQGGGEIVRKRPVTRVLYALETIATTIVLPMKREGRGHELEPFFDMCRRQDSMPRDALSADLPFQLRPHPVLSPTTFVAVNKIEL